jgi:hypothetical protein
MRPLTQQEIDDAPSWANYYSIQKDEPYFTGLAMDQRGLDFKPIPRKEFDITNHRFSDNDITHAFRSIGGVFINCDQGVTLSKSDIIALAKTVKLTAEDLK